MYSSQPSLGPGFPLSTAHTYSTPELHCPAPLSIYPAPPSAPRPALPVSSSTPDLASQTAVGPGGSSPDLVSRRTLGQAAGPGRGRAGQPGLHRTFDNLAQQEEAGDPVRQQQRAYSTEVSQHCFLFSSCNLLYRFERSYRPKLKAELQTKP